MKAIYALLAVFALTASTYAGFGELASNNACHCMVFNQTPGTVMTNLWGLVNTENHSVYYWTIYNRSIVTVSPATGIIPANTTVFVNVSVDSTGMPAGYHYEGNVTAAVNTTAHNQAGVAIQLGTLKRIEINVNSPTTTSPTSTSTSSTTTSTISMSEAANPSDANAIYGFEVFAVMCMLISTVAVGTFATRRKR